jgi:hypothetical protein
VNELCRSGRRRVEGSAKSRAKGASLPNFIRRFDNDANFNTHKLSDFILTSKTMKISMLTNLAGLSSERSRKIGLSETQRFIIVRETAKIFTFANRAPSFSPGRSWRFRWSQIQSCDPRKLNSLIAPRLKFRAHFVSRYRRIRHLF